MGNNVSIQELYKDVYQLKAEIHQIGTLVDRLDTTIDKLTEVSKNISELLAVQGTRLQYQEKMSNQLAEWIEQTKQDSAKTKKSVTDEMVATEKKIMEEIKLIREDMKTQHEKIDSKLAVLEQWKWIVTGGSIVIGFIISKLFGLIKF